MPEFRLGADLLGRPRGGPDFDVERSCGLAVPAVRQTIFGHVGPAAMEGLGAAESPDACFVSRPLPDEYPSGDAHSSIDLNSRSVVRQDSVLGAERNGSESGGVGVGVGGNRPAGDVGSLTTRYDASSYVGRR